MWSLRLSEEDGFYLTYDRSRRPDPNFRGIWEYLCKDGSESSQKYVRINREAGHLVAKDDEGNWRMLILEG